jgi:hypothetical protein
MDVLYEKIGALCAEKCEKEPDPCAATGSYKYCVNGSAPIDPATNPEGPAGYTCPSGKVCEYTGFIEGGGQTCYLFNTWTLDEIPPECEDCGCNCSNDCGECQVCNENGECETDPVCENTLYQMQYRLVGYYNSAFPEYDCRNKNNDAWLSFANNVAYENIGKYYVEIQTFGNGQTNCNDCILSLNGYCGIKPNGFNCKYARIKYKDNPGFNVQAGYLYHFQITCPIGGGSNLIVSDRQIELRAVPMP